MRVLLSSILLLGHANAENCRGACQPQKKQCTFTAKVDLFASSTGYFKFEECGDEPHPTLEMRQGWKYKFLQNDDTNWFHPLGFAYEADGAILGVDELEPGISRAGDPCDSDNTCQAPRYFVEGKFVGDSFDNANGIAGEDFGLDVYEPAFQQGRGDWQEQRDKGRGFFVEVTLTDSKNTDDLFYFCHIHGGMSGRIVVLDETGEAVNPNPNTPPLPYGREVPSDFDSKCGTFGTGDFQRGSKLCPANDYVFCDNDSEAADPEFSECMFALDCHMHHYMRVNLEADKTAAFMHQMIPHHENAVNMAKVALKFGIEEGKDPDGEVEQLMYEIINNQNAQITFMRNWLIDHGYASSTEAQCGDYVPEHGKAGGDMPPMNGVYGMAGISPRSNAPFRRPNFPSAFGGRFPGFGYNFGGMYGQQWGR